jgi:YHS domain-containing protein
MKKHQFQMIHSHQDSPAALFKTDARRKKPQMDTATKPRSRPSALSFDPVCGSPLPPLLEAKPYRSGGYTYYFCSAMCRRLFIDQKDNECAAAPQDATPAREGRPT